MKIEFKPQISSSKPHYASALAFLASAVLMTGCQAPGNVGVDGAMDVGDPPALTTDDMTLAGEVAIETTATEEAVMLEGDVVWEGNVEDPFQLNLGESGMSASFAEQNDQLVLSHSDDFAILLEEIERLSAHAQSFCSPAPFFSIEENLMQSAGCAETENTVFFWISSDQSGDTPTSAEWFREMIKNKPCTEFDWGMITEGQSADGIRKIVLIDVSKFDSMTPEYAQIIAEDYLREDTAE